MCQVLKRITVFVMVFSSLLLSAATVTQSVFHQVGKDINGAAAGIESGTSVAFSADGNRMAVGAPVGTEDRVTVYELQGSQWVQLGNVITGLDYDEHLGWSVSLSADGTRVAVGAPHASDDGDNHLYYMGSARIYELQGASWVQLGNAIYENELAEGLGWSVALNAEGNRVAVGAIVLADVTTVPKVRIYELQGASWVQMGSALEPGNVPNGFGHAVALSANGSRVAVGVPGYDKDGNSDIGQVRVYAYTGYGWGQLGGDINGIAADNRCGSAVSLNADGTRVAVGIPGHDNNRGQVQVYDRIDGNWQQVGPNINGEAEGDGFGSSVALSADGLWLLVGAPHNVGNNSVAYPDRGHARLYKLSQSGWIAWIKQNSDINGEDEGDLSGTSVAVNADGTRFAVGAPGNDGDGVPDTKIGHVRVFEIQNSEADQVGGDISGTADDYLGSSPSLSADGSRIAFIVDLSDVRVYRLLGSSWVALGSPFGGGDPDALSLNADGTRVAVGYSWQNEVRVFELNSGEWVPLGTPIEGGANAVSFGTVVSLSDDGTRLAVGDPYDRSVDIGSGMVRIFALEGGSWNQLGGDLIGEAGFDSFGTSVSLSGDGARVAVGAPGWDDSSTGTALDNRGRVTIYNYTRFGWLQMGGAINGEASGDGRGASVSLNADGTRVAVLAPGSDGGDSTNTNRGKTTVYAYSNSSWVQLGGSIVGESEGDGAYGQVRLSRDGMRVAVSAPYNDAHGENSGMVRIYRFASFIYNGLELSYWSKLGDSIYGDTEGDMIRTDLSADGLRVAVSAPGNDEYGLNSGKISIYQLEGQKKAVNPALIMYLLH